MVDPGFELEAKDRPARIGFDRVVGYLDVPFAASVLRQAGFADVSDMLGGYGAWAELVLAPA